MSSRRNCCRPVSSQPRSRSWPRASTTASRDDPIQSARWLVEHGISSNYEHALQTLRDIPYEAWRTFDPDDTLRFFSLRLREAGMVKHTPQEIIARGTDWRFLEELMRELKA